MLTALENDPDPSKRLSAVVTKALRFLEFEVDDIDEKIKSAIKKEDLWVREGNFLAITEVTGTVNKNPKTKEFNDIFARMATIYKRQNELPLPIGANISGLLVLNYDVGTHPSKRPKPYTGEDENIIHTALDQNIGVLTTVELHKILVAVKQGVLSKPDARAVLKKFGRIEFIATR